MSIQKDDLDDTTHTQTRFSILVPLLCNGSVSLKLSRKYLVPTYFAKYIRIYFRPIHLIKRNNLEKSLNSLLKSSFLRIK